MNFPNPMRLAGFPALKKVLMMVQFAGWVGHFSLEADHYLLAQRLQAHLCLMHDLPKVGCRWQNLPKVGFSLFLVFLL